MKKTLPLLLLAVQGAAVSEPPILSEAKPLTSANQPIPETTRETTRTTHASRRESATRADYLRETFGVLPSTATKRPEIPAQSTRAEAFVLLLKSLRDNRMESSREKSNRLKRVDHPLENEAQEFLTHALGGNNASNPVARSVLRHLASEAGRQELVAALGASQNSKKY